jgi:hypothetical protein
MPPQPLHAAATPTTTTAAPTTTTAAAATTTTTTAISNTHLFQLQNYSTGFNKIPLCNLQ